MSRESFANAIAAAQKGNYAPALKMARENPQMAATISKLNTAPHTTAATTNSQTSQTLPDIGKMQTLSDRTALNIADAETVMEILPELGLAQEILISAIIAPKDMMTTELVYKGGEGIVSADVAAALTDAIKEHFQTNYKIESQLAEILRDIFFRTGSWVYAVIPENSIDQLINGTGRITLEGLKESIDSDGTVKPKGLLGNAVKDTPAEAAARPGLSMEAFDGYEAPRNIDPMMVIDRHLAAKLPTTVSILDNPDVLKLPDIQRKLREQRVNTLVNAGTAIKRATGTAQYAAETFGTITERQVASQIFKTPQFAYKPMARVYTQDQLSRRAIGNPLVLHLPSESVMPVHVPGKPEEHVGYFVLLDAEGNPVSKVNADDQYRQLSTRFTGGDSFASTMIKKTHGQIEGNFNSFNRQHIDVSARVFGELIEQELIMRLNNGGIYTSGVAVAKQEEIYRIMLARAMAKQHTQLLFLPVELTTYMAVRYNGDGIGESILERMKTLTSIRVMTMFANVAAMMKNSIGRTQVTFTMDQDDPDAQKSLEILQHEFLNTRQGVMPFGMNNPADIVSWMQRAGYEFVTEGSPNLPEVKIDVQQKADNHVKIDTELDEQLRKQSIMAFGVSPEQVDATYNAEFATVANNNNLMLSKRALKHQEQLVPFLTDHHRKVLRNTEGLLRHLAEIIDNNFDKIKEDWLKDQQGKKIDFTNDDGKQQRGLIIGEVVEQFIRSFEVSLPKPNTASLTNQMAALDEYSKALDVALEAWLPPDGLTDSSTGQLNSEFQMLKALVKGHFMRVYMAENGIMPELAQLTTKDEAGKPMLDLYQAQKDHVQAVSASLTGLLKSFRAQKELSNKTLEENGVEGGGGGSDTTTDDGSGGGGGSNDGFDDFNLGGDDDNPLEQAPDNTAPVENQDGTEPKEDEPTGDDKSSSDDTGKGEDEQNQA